MTKFYIPGDEDWADEAYSFEVDDEVAEQLLHLIGRDEVVGEITLVEHDAYFEATLGVYLDDEELSEATDLMDGLMERAEEVVSNIRFE